MRAFNPFPGTDVKSVVSNELICFSFAKRTIAFEIGCSLFSSIEKAF